MSFIGSPRRYLGTVSDPLRVDVLPRCSIEDDVRVCFMLDRAKTVQEIDMRRDVALRLAGTIAAIFGCHVLPGPHCGKGGSL